MYTDKNKRVGLVISCLKKIGYKPGGYYSPPPWDYERYYSPLQVGLLQLQAQGMGTLDLTEEDGNRNYVYCGPWKVLKQDVLHWNGLTNWSSNTYWVSEFSYWVFEAWRMVKVTGWVDYWPKPGLFTDSGVLRSVLITFLKSWSSKWVWKCVEAGGYRIISAKRDVNGLQLILLTMTIYLKKLLGIIWVFQRLLLGHSWASCAGPTIPRRICIDLCSLWELLCKITLG